MRGSGFGSEWAAVSCDAEVQHLYGAVGRHHHVGRRDVAMDDPAVVRVGERPGNRLADPGDGRDVERRPCRELAERASGDELHHDERPATVLADVVDRDDARVREPCRGGRLATEPSEESSVGGELGAQHLHRDGPVEPSVDGLEHLTHAATPEQRSDLVAGGEEHAQERWFGQGGRHAASMVARPGRTRPPVTGSPHAGALPCIRDARDMVRRCRPPSRSKG